MDDVRQRMLFIAARWPIALVWLLAAFVVIGRWDGAIRDVATEAAVAGIGAALTVLCSLAAFAGSRILNKQAARRKTATSGVVWLSVLPMFVLSLALLPDGSSFGPLMLTIGLVIAVVTTALLNKPPVDVVPLVSVNERSLIPPDDISAAPCLRGSAGALSSRIRAADSDELADVRELAAAADSLASEDNLRNQMLQGEGDLDGDEEVEPFETDSALEAALLARLSLGTMPAAVGESDETSESNHADHRFASVDSDETQAAEDVHEPLGVPSQDGERLQWMSRSIRGGNEVIEGGCRVHFLPGQKQAVLHLPFTPALNGVPEFDCEVNCDSDIRLRVTSILPYGARLELSRSEGLAAEQTQELLYVASAPEHRQSAAA